MSATTALQGRGILPATSAHCPTVASGPRRPVQ